MTKVTFETATLADSLKKAERVAPNKGAAFDKAAGIVLEISPGQDFPIIVRSTNLEIFYMEWVDVLSAEGPATVWRIPSRLIAGTVAGLPIGSGKTVTLEDELAANGVARVLRLSSGRMRAKFPLADESYYPMWSAFDPETLTVCNDLGGKIALVDWAAAKDNPETFILGGIHLDGRKVVATDKYKLATVPLDVPHLEQPVTIPSKVLSQVLKQTGEVRIAATEHEFLIMPDEHTQVRTVIYAHKYPPVDRVMRTDWPCSVKVSKTALLEKLALANNFTGSDRIPTLRLWFGNEEIALMIQNVDVGLLGDVVEIPGQAQHERCEFKFTPKNLQDALDKAPNETVTIFYDSADTTSPILIDGGSGFQVWVVARADPSVGSA